MPGYLWELAQSCFRHEAAMRPTVKAIAGLLSEMKRQASSNLLISGPATSSSAGVNDAPLGQVEPYTDPFLNDPREDMRNTETSASAAPMQGNQLHETKLITVRFGPMNLDGLDHENVGISTASRSSNSAMG
ncbi:hypothetical protein B0H13DRAFT_1924090 [Mycena leptocephala]|nr:hypothetical protein B0H13DRAFT_1924090 [Mycena leptocephala]